MYVCVHLEPALLFVCFELLHRYEVVFDVLILFCPDVTYACLNGTNRRRRRREREVRGWGSGRGGGAVEKKNKTNYSVFIFCSVRHELYTIII